jgi:cysteine synthase A
MLQEAERTGALTPGTMVIEPTSGNTGIGLAMACAVKGYRLILVMPENMSKERRIMLRAYGAEVILSPATDGMSGAVKVAEQLLEETKGWMPGQFHNPQNPLTHARHTAKEILEDFPEGLDLLIAGIGTGGHLSGVGMVLKHHFPTIRVIGVEPAKSAVLQGGAPGKHAIQGIGAGFVPETLNKNVPDQIISIGDHEACFWMKELAKTEGIFAGTSTGANLAAIQKLLPLTARCRILTFACDRGERYLSQWKDDSN